MQKYRLEHAAEIDKQRRAYRESHREILRQRAHTYAETHVEQRKQWRLKTRERKRNRVFMQRYGISTTQFDEMKKRQGGKCAICKKIPVGKPLHVDHDHVTSDVRELLCFKCNAMLGQCNDNTDILRSAIRYLDKHAQMKLKLVSA
jgi:Recombination endonuclease VII